jgi:hypothetical protein
VESIAGAVRRSAEAIRNNFFANGANSSKELKSGFAPRVLYLCGSPREYPETKNPEPTGLETANFGKLDQSVFNPVNVSQSWFRQKSQKPGI